MKRFLAPFFCTLLLSSAYAQEEVLQPSEVLTSILNDTSPTLREMPMIPPLDRSKDGREKEVPNKFDFGRIRNETGAPEERGETDPVVQRVGGNTLMSVPLVNFEGVGNRQGVYPPDPDGDVGPNHYIQMVNSSFVIYGKSGNILYGPADNSTLWQGFVGPWTGTNDGDPIVLYDHLADRWLVTQFALPTFPNGPFYELLAVSQTSDPLGAWHRYAFQFTNLPDYPKLGVWPDGYYMSVNSFAPPPPPSFTFVGPAAVVFERSVMLTGGNPAQGVIFQLPTSQGHLLPCNLDGPAPPANAPNYFGGVEDGAVFGGSDRFEVFELQVDWVTPSNSTFTGPTAILTAAFDGNMCNGNRNCIPQPSTAVGLDALADLMMNRLQYRNFGSYQTLVTNHTVDENGSNHAGIRWYELRKTTGAWSMYQQGTFAPDANHRWVGSIAMNGQGDIALGYSVASASVFPTIRYTGRHAADPLGTMTLAEQTIITGTGSQTGTANRWGDYTSMSVDPTDDQTFWYTNEYIQTTGTAPWQTRIASFQFTDPTPQASLSYLTSSISGGNGNGTIDFNECNDLFITLRNTGTATATAITTTLSSTTPGVTIAQPVSSYSNIVASSSGVNTVPFEVSTSPGFVCGTPIVLNLAVDYTGSTTQNLVFVLPTCVCPNTVGSDSLASGDPTQPGRITRNGVPSSCASPKVCPGVFTTVDNRFYDLYTYTNTSASTACVTIVLQSSCAGNIFGVAYSGSFNPASLCANYLADMGGSGDNTSMSFDVAAGATFVFVVHEVTPGAGCGNYSFTVSGLNCGTDGGGQCVPLPVQLSSFTGSVGESGDVFLEWTTVSEVNNYGFEVQRSNELNSGFQTVPNGFIPGHGTTNQPQYYSFTHSTPVRGTAYYRLKQIDFDGTVHYTEPIQIDILTNIAQTEIPLVTKLYQNYPNPFNPTTSIRYDVAEKGRVVLAIHDILGRKVTTLVDAEREAGKYSIDWSSENIANGVYFYRLQVGTHTQVKRLTVLK